MGVFSGTAVPGLTDGLGIGVMYLQFRVLIFIAEYHDGGFILCKINGRLDLAVSSNVNFMGWISEDGAGSLEFQQLNLGGSGSISINEGDVSFLNGLSLSSSIYFTRGYHL